MGDAILRIPRDVRVRTYRAWDTYDGVVSLTSKRQPSCQSSFIYVSDTEEETLKEVTRRYFHKASGKHGSDGMGCLVFHTEMYQRTCGEIFFTHYFTTWWPSWISNDMSLVWKLNVTDVYLIIFFLATNLF